MWFGKRRALMANLDSLLTAAASATDQMVNWMQVDAAIIRYTLTTSGVTGLTIPNDDIRLLLAEQLASILMAKENLMALQGRKHFFDIRPLYVPISPGHFDECVAKIWARIWPDCPYPRYEQLSPEQRYFCFGPDAKKFAPVKK